MAGTLENRSIPPSHNPPEGDVGGGCCERFEIRTVVPVSAGAAGTVATEAKVPAAGLDAFPPTGAIPENRAGSPVGDAAAFPASGAGHSPEMVSLVNNRLPLLLRLGGKTAPKAARVGTNSAPSAEEVALAEAAPVLPVLVAATTGATAAAAAQGEEAAAEKTAAAISPCLVEMAPWSATVPQSALGVMPIDAAARHAPKEGEKEEEEEVEAVEPQTAG